MEQNRKTPTPEKIVEAAEGDIETVRIALIPVGIPK